MNMFHSFLMGNWDTNVRAIGFKNLESDDNLMNMVNHKIGSYIRKE